MATRSLKSLKKGKNSAELELALEMQRQQFENQPSLIEVTSDGPQLIQNVQPTHFSVNAALPTLPMAEFDNSSVSGNEDGDIDPNELAILRKLHKALKSTRSIKPARDSSIKMRRTRYSRSQKEVILKFIDEYKLKDPTVSMKAIAKAVGNIEGYEKVTAGMLSEWMKNRDRIRMKPGRTVCQEFEQEVFDQCNLLMSQSLHQHSSLLGDESLFSYEIIRRSAELVKNQLYDGEAKWLNNDKTKNLQFSDKWIFGFLKRFNLRSNVTKGMEE